MLPSGLRQKFFSAPGALLSPIWMTPTSLQAGFQAGSLARAAAAARWAGAPPCIISVASLPSLLLAAVPFGIQLTQAPASISAQIDRALSFICSPQINGFAPSATHALG